MFHIKCLLIIALQGIALSTYQVAGLDNASAALACPEAANIQLTCRLCALVRRDFARDLYHVDRGRLVQCCDLQQTKDICGYPSHHADSGSIVARNRGAKASKLEPMRLLDRPKRHYVFTLTSAKAPNKGQQQQPSKVMVTMYDMRRRHPGRSTSEWMRHEFFKKRDDSTKDETPKGHSEDAESTTECRSPYQTSVIHLENDDFDDNTGSRNDDDGNIVNAWPDVVEKKQQRNGIPNQNDNTAPPNRWAKYFLG